MKRASWVFFLLSIWVTHTLSGCPCGCGSAFSLSMYPGELWKFRLASSRQYFEKYVQANGVVSEDFSSPRHTDTLQFAAAKAWTDQFSTSISIPLESNWHEEYGSHVGFSDPSIGGRWVVNPYDMNALYLPQTTLHLTYKHPVAKNIDDKNNSDRHVLDVHSNGWQEILPGVDLSFYFGTWSVVVSEVAILRSARTKKIGEEEEVQYHSGLGLRSALSFGYTFYGYGQVAAGVERETMAANRLDGEKVEDSQVVKHALFTTMQMRVGERKTLEIGFRRNAREFQNKNTPRSTQLSLAYVHTL